MGGYKFSNIRNKLNYGIMKLCWYFIVDFYYFKDGCPKRCPYCNKQFIIHQNEDFINGIVSEYIDICGNCEKKIGHWGYGGYNPNYRKFSFIYSYINNKEENLN